MSEPASFTHARESEGLSGCATLSPHPMIGLEVGTPRLVSSHECSLENAGYVEKFSEGLKFDDGKDPWQLAPWDAFRAIVKVLAFGAKKYEPRNWEKGMAWSRPYAALIRHMTAWWEGEHKDADSGFSHLWCAGCMLCFLIAYELRGIGKDDRPNAP